jgi:hypothetical protein
MFDIIVGKQFIDQFQLALVKDFLRNTAEVDFVLFR